MKVLILLLSLITLITGCSNLGKTFNPNPYSNTTVTEVADSLTKNAFIEYEPYEYLVDIENKRAETAFSEPNLSNIPSNGLLTIRIATGDIESCNPKFWRVVVKDSNNNVVLNEKGKGKTADYHITNGQTFWNNLFVIVAPKKIAPPFKVFAIYEPLNYRWGFQVSSN